MSRASRAGILRTDRIDYLLKSSDFSAQTVTVVGLGSGGAAVMERLAMCGIGRWRLFDDDVLEPVNLVKHPFRRADIGRPKVDIAEEWILDRNPAAEVRTWRQKVEDGDEDFRLALQDSDIAICAADSYASRSVVNEASLATSCPTLFGLVFRTGLGGEVYISIPGMTGCYDCLGLYISLQGIDLDSYIDLTAEENHRIYGLEERNFRASSLGVDIGIVANFHAHLAVLLLAAEDAEYLTKPSFNWLTIGLRRQSGLFDSLYEVSRRLLRPLNDCATCAHARSSTTESAADGRR